MALLLPLSPSTLRHDPWGQLAVSARPNRSARRPSPRCPATSAGLSTISPKEESTDSLAVRHKVPAAWRHAAHKLRLCRPLPGDRIHPHSENYNVRATALRASRLTPSCRPCFQSASSRSDTI